jgi:hypothetical protein
MKIKIAFIVVILAALVGLGGSQLIAAHHTAGHVAHQSQRARAVAKCKLKSTPQERRACLKKVKARFAGHN